MHFDSGVCWRPRRRAGISVTHKTRLKVDRWSRGGRRQDELRCAAAAAAAGRRQMAIYESFNLLLRIETVLLRLVLHCVAKKVISKIRVLYFETLFQALDLEN